MRMSDGDSTNDGGDLETLARMIGDLHDIRDRLNDVDDPHQGDVYTAAQVDVAVEQIMDTRDRVKGYIQDGEWPPEE